MALTKDRNTKYRNGEDFSDPVAANEKIFAGALVVLNAAGNVAAGSTATGLKARGVAQDYADNTGGADGEIHVPVRKGTFNFKNDGSVTQADIGGTAYIVDDETVANSDGGATRSIAGEIQDLDDDGVWVKIS